MVQDIIKVTVQRPYTVDTSKKSESEYKWSKRYNYFNYEKQYKPVNICCKENHLLQTKY